MARLQGNDTTTYLDYIKDLKNKKLLSEIQKKKIEGYKKISKFIFHNQKLTHQQKQMFKEM